ncbi:unnamed protein product [Cunninghamella blakesleeana]
MAESSCSASCNNSNNSNTIQPKTNTSNNLNNKWKKWKSILLWWNSEEWFSCWVGLVLFGSIVTAVKNGIPQPEFLPWRQNPFMTFATVGNYGVIVLFFVMGALVWLSMASYRPLHWQLYPLGYTVVFFVALISNMLASNVVLHSASLGASIWAIILGCALRNVLSIFQKNDNQPLAPWLKIAQQTELYIAISLVLLCIDFSVLKPLAPRALFVSWIDTPTLFMLVAWIGWRFMDIDKQTSIIMSGATFICGSSAAIALGASMGVPHKTEFPIAIISIFTIPSIIALPYIAKELHFPADVSGAWFGGCVDSTGAVIAAASIYDDKVAISTSAVVKMMQNVLIGPISVVLAWAWSQYEIRVAYLEEQERLHETPEDEEENDHVDHQHDSYDNQIIEERRIHSTTEDSYNIPLEHIQKIKRKSDFTKPSKKTMKKQEKPLVLLWKRFPKFVIGFIITAVLFNTVVSNDPEERTLVNNFCFYVSEYFSTLSFVSIGLGLKFGELKQNIRSLGKLCGLYIIAQLVDIIVTAVLAWVAFIKM